MLSKDNSPMFFKGRRFHPICKASFVSNTFGVELFCKQLGYRSGLITETSLPLVEPAIRVGRCLEVDTELAECTGGGNTMETGGGCSGNCCEAGQSSRMKVVCFGGEGKVHTCVGK